MSREPEVEDLRRRRDRALALGGAERVARHHGSGRRTIRERIADLSMAHSRATAALALLNSRFTSIAGGTNEMQRNTIGERVLGLPREPSFDSRKPFREVVEDAPDWSGAVG